MGESLKVVDLAFVAGAVLGAFVGGGNIIFVALMFGLGAINGALMVAYLTKPKREEKPICV